MGSILLRLGHHEQAAEHERLALGLASDSGIRFRTAGALLGLAAAHLCAGRHPDAVDHARQALGLARRLGYRVLEGQALAVLAAVELDLGEHHQAAKHARQALSIQRETGHRLGQARSLVVLGHALRHTGADGANLPCWQEAFELFTEAGSLDADEVAVLLRAPPAVAGIHSGAPAHGNARPSRHEGDGSP